MIRIDKGFFDEMVAHGLSNLPNEACGVLAGKEGRPVKFFPMTNADGSPLTYRFEPKESLRVWNEIEDEGFEQLAIVHTHTAKAGALRASARPWARRRCPGRAGHRSGRRRTS